MLRDTLLYDANLALEEAAQHLRAFTERAPGARMKLLALVSTDHKPEANDGLIDADLLLTVERRLDKAIGF